MCACVGVRVCVRVRASMSNREPDNGEVSCFICTSNAKNNELLSEIRFHYNSEKKEKYGINLGSAEESDMCWSVL